jgi:hypothetical protein
MNNRTTSYSLFVLFVVLLWAGVLAVFAFADGKGKSGGQGVGFTPIVGSPLTINVAVDGSFQVKHDGFDPSSSGQFFPPTYDEADAGFFIWYGDYVIGPDFENHELSAANTYDPWTAVSQSAVTGTGTEDDPYVIDTKVIHSASGVTGHIFTKYVDGQDYFTVSWGFCTPEPAVIATFLVADFHLPGSGDGIGHSEPVGYAVGSHNETEDWYQIFSTNQTGALDHLAMAGNYGSIWDAIGEAGAPGTGFDNSISDVLDDIGGGMERVYDINTPTLCKGDFTEISFRDTPIYQEPPEPPTSVDVANVSGRTSAGLLLIVVALVMVAGLAGVLVLRRRFVS